MNKIKIVTDSTIDMGEEFIKQYEIEVVPLSVTINGNTYLDAMEVKPADFLNMMQESEELPKTSQPPTGTFLELYDRLGMEGYEVLSIHMTGNMSGTVRSAQCAAEMSKAKVTVIDSLFISKALAFQVKEAAIMVKQGKSMEAIINQMEFVQKHSKLYIMVDTLEHLVKGGRIGKGRAFIGSLLNIKPIAALKAGELHPVAKVRNYSQVIRYMTKQFAEDIKGKTVLGVGIAHAGANELSIKLKERIAELTEFEGIEIDFTNSVISSHTGPGAIALMYYFK